ncbi:hypothetical protein [Streptomyces sp. NBC_00286]|uniref:hypothetical protein n=1 Tax=Streptomyces sp. NBC_00286 TaxID=2975701 RepID=UPI002E2CE15F|nr:hypothetical protein [Streptomyces sp. NBC_00286]
MRDAVADGRTTVHEADPCRTERPRGRHRKPRPRRMLVTVGGLALAAGALSLMRLAPEPPGGTGGGVTATDIDPAEIEAADIEPADVEPTAVGATQAPAPVSDTGEAAAEGTPTPRTSASPAAKPPPNRGDQPEGPADPTVTPKGPLPTPSGKTNPHDATEGPTPAKPPAGNPSTPNPQPQPPTPPPGDRTLCVPIVGLCLDAPG